MQIYNIYTICVYVTYNYTAKILIALLLNRRSINLIVRLFISVYNCVSSPANRIGEQSIELIIVFTDIYTYIHVCEY